jgi:hypothetical protein
MKLCLIAAGLAGGLLATASANASISYSVAGSTYSQNFDSLPNLPVNTNLQTATFTTGWIDDSTTVAGVSVGIPGWFLNHPTDTGGEGGANGNQRLRAGRGSATTGSFWSFGGNASSSSSSTERALGMLPSSTVSGLGDSMRIGLLLTNTTGVPLTSFTVTYDGEQWRDGVGVGAISLSWLYMDELVDPAPNNTWFNAGSAAHFVNSAGFDAPVTNNDDSFPDSTNSVPPLGTTLGITATVDLSSNPWMPGEDLMLRWSQVRTSDSNDGLAIDNLNFTAAVPEPGSLALLGLGGMFLVRRRSR